MAKLTLTDIASLANTLSAKQALNDNFAEIEAALEDTLSRSGQTPNQMTADIDLNSNDILNANSVDASQYLLNGVPLEQSVAYSDKLYELFSGTGAQTEYILSRHPGSLGNLEISISGVVQRPGLDFNFEDTTLIFVLAPPIGTDNILVRYDFALPTGLATAQGLSYAPGGSGQRIRDTQARLRDNKSVQDYSAVGDGVTDDTVALVDADAENALVFLAGYTYRVASDITLTSDVRFERGAMLSIDSGATVTFNGHVEAGTFQIFSGDGDAAGFLKNGTLYPEWWGADPWQTVDSAVPMQKALTASLAKRLELSGIYLTSVPLVIDFPILVEGKSKFNTGFKTTSATANVLEVNSHAGPLTSIEVRNVMIDSTVVKTDGFGIAILADSGGLLYDGVFDNIYMTSNVRGGGMLVEAAIFLRLKDISIDMVGANKVGFHFAGVDATSYVVNVFTDSCVVRSGIAGGNTIGMLIDSYCEGFYMTKSTFESPGINHGLVINNSAGAPQPPKHIWMDKFISDSNTGHGFNILAARSVRMTDCWSASCTGDGIRLDDTVDIEIKGHMAIGNGQYGCEIRNSAVQTRIDGGIWDANGQASPGTYDGIVILPNTVDFTIVNAEFYREGTTLTHQYDIHVLAGTSDRYIIKNNRTRGWLTGAINDGGTGLAKFIGDNIN